MAKVCGEKLINSSADGFLKTLPYSHFRAQYLLALFICLVSTPKGLFRPVLTLNFNPAMALMHQVLEPKVGFSPKQIALTYLRCKYLAQGSVLGPGQITDSPQISVNVTLKGEKSCLLCL